MSRPEDGSGRLAADRQFFSLNQRPFQPSKLQKAFHEAYKTYNPDQYPALVINIELPSGQSFHECLFPAVN